MAPSTGSSGWDAVLQIGIAAALLGTLVLLARDYRNRR
jgi:LPXTG-motif cell wall-anchored protein